MQTAFIVSRTHRVSGPTARLAAFACLLTALTAGPRLLGQNGLTVHVEAAFPQDSVSVDRQFIGTAQTLISTIRLDLAEPVGYLQEPGFPRLPFVTRVVALPAGSTVLGTDITPGQMVPIQQVGLVEWAQEPWVAQAANQPPVFPTGPDGGMDFIHYAGPDWIPLDPSVFQVPAWPTSPAERVDAREAAGQLLLVYRLYPVQWMPQQDLATAATSILLDIRYQPGPATQPATYAEAMAREDLKAIAANPGAIVSIRPHSFPPGPDTRYLIITDNFHWSADMTRGAGAGNLVDEFRRLAQWKTEKGLRASVVKITDIVNGKYGDFVSGALDLQEVLRNFLKFAHSEWSTYWVLLGGDVDVVPARMAIGNVRINDHYFRLDPSKPLPEPFFYYWDGASGSLRIHVGNNGTGILDSSVVPGTLIVSVKTGRAFSRIARIPSADDPGWIYTDDSYSGDTRFFSDRIILRGPASDILGTDFYSVQPNNSIPTDLYYSSLDGPDYGIPGLHDWDRNDNGLYGQYNGAPSDGGAYIDGMNIQASIALGRAPVSTQAEAKTFVDKVLAYEKFEGVSTDFARRLLLTADNYYGGPAVAAGGTDPPAEGTFFLGAGGTSAKLHFKDAPGKDKVRLFAWNEPGWFWQIPYNAAASATSLGYFYCTKSDYATASVSGDLPAPTKYVKVVGPAGSLNPLYYFFNVVGLDQAVTDKEAVKRILATWAPGLDLRKRMYKDIQDVPGYGTEADLREFSGDAIRAAFEEGYNVISLSGHGYWTGCCGMDISWVPALTNGFAGGVVYADSCLTNELEEAKADGSMSDAVSERFLTTAGGGAAAYIGNSRYSLIGVGGPIEQAFWLMLATGERRLGSAFNSKWVYSARQNERWVNLVSNFLGDPEMTVWLDEPKDLAVSHPAQVEVGDPLPVQVDALGGGALPGALVCVTGPGDFIQVQEAGPSGAASFSTAGRSSGDVLTVTVTFIGYIPYQGTVTLKGVFTLIARADSNLDGVIDIADAVTILVALFGTAQLACPDAADANGDGTVDISDGVTILSYLFLGGQIMSTDPACP